MKKLGMFILQLAILWGLNEIGYLIVDGLHLPLPGNVCGMMLLFILLATRILPLHWISDAASFLIKHLAFFFIPIAVGLMDYGDLFLHNGIALFLALVGSAAVGVFVTGKTAQTLSRKGEESRRESGYNRI